MVKKILVLSVFLSILFFLILIYLIFFNNANNDNSIRTEKIYPTSFINNSNAHKKIFIDFNYPAELNVTRRQITPSGEADLISLGENAVIEVQKIPYSVETLNSIESVFNNSHYSKNELSLGGQVKGVEYEGILNLGNINIKTIATVFVANEIIYKIQLTYRSQEINPTYEQDYRSIISLIKLK